MRVRRQTAEFWMGCSLSGGVEGRPEKEKTAAVIQIGGGEGMKDTAVVWQRKVEDVQCCRDERRMFQ